MTDKQKAKAYDEALKRASAAHKDEDKHLKATLERIFPELTESEDEKIRKELLIFCRTLAVGRTSVLANNIDFNKWISWLERQGEHANFLSKIQVGDKVTRNEAGVLVNLSQLKRVAKPNEEQGDQKASCTSIVETSNGGINALVTRELPTEMKSAEESLDISSDEYNKIVDECLFGEQKLTEFERGLFDMLTDISNPCTADCVKSHSGKLLSIARKMIALEQKPEENKGNIGGISSKWSEEDEPQKELAESYLAKFDEKFPILPTLKGKQLADYKNFLNKCQQIFRLKYWDIRPIQAKLFEKLSLLWAAWGAEHLQGLEQTDGDMDNEISMWSEEDKKIINGLIDSLTRISLNTRTDSTSPNYTFYKEIDWLKSLRPQNRWKPTDEQMGCLSDAIEHYNSLGYPAPKLKELLDDLKKLKGEV